MLEETTHDGTHLYIIAETGNAGTQAAYAAHEEPYLHAGSGRLEKLTNDVGVGQGIHLGENRGGLTGARK